MATKLTDETLRKIPDFEEIFVLRAADELAPLTIMEWIKNNFFTAKEEKLRSAFEVALAMNKQEDVLRKRAD